jgi:hypothetical protein
LLLPLLRHVALQVAVEQPQSSPTQPASQTHDEQLQKPLPAPLHSSVLPPIGQGSTETLQNGPAQPRSAGQTQEPQMQLPPLAAQAGSQGRRVALAGRARPPVRAEARAAVARALAAALHAAAELARRERHVALQCAPLKQLSGSHTHAPQTHVLFLEGSRQAASQATVEQPQSSPPQPASQAQVEQLQKPLSLQILPNVLTLQYGPPQPRPVGQTHAPQSQEPPLAAQAASHMELEQAQSAPPQPGWQLHVPQSQSPLPAHCRLFGPASAQGEKDTLQCGPE